MQNGLMAFGEGADPNFVEWMMTKAERDRIGKLEPTGYVPGAWYSSEHYRYVDLAQEIVNQGVESYSDFEGFGGHDDVMALLNQPAVQSILESGPAFVRDILAHWIFECCNEAERPTLDQTLEAAALMVTIFRTRFYLKLDAEER